jgi:hypothetical protein
MKSVEHAFGISFSRGETDSLRMYATFLNFSICHDVVSETRLATLSETF